ncbi:hypothetical protein [Pedobacter heparinus]|uniref:hypothetical protein n=1 Tax=Pedobacter heparinus TaxID=984 RepID=UPI00292D9CC2|nr:hypothetical protein [Pedobacter heparinus]
MKIPEEKLSISDNIIQAIVDQPSNAPKILKEDLSNQKTEISYLIDNYLPGRYKVSIFKIIELVFTDELHGKFRINYNATEFSGCELTETELANFINVNFAIDKDTFQVILTGEEIRERDSFEEF